jgi:signal transduction histidine kinase
VDDEPGNLLALEATLECLGQNLVRAHSGPEALRAVLNQDFAVILLDVQMAGMNGLETAAMIREREQSRHIPIIFLTGVVKTAEMMFKGYSTGAVDYLMKPVVSGVLRAKVEVFVELALIRQELRDEAAERARVAAEVSKLNMDLEQKNQDLMEANADLETFSYSVSHDLRAPLRHIALYLEILEESFAGSIGEEARSHIKLVKESTGRMGQLIDALLEFARVGRSEMLKTRVDMRALLEDARRDLEPDLEGRNVVWSISPLPEVSGDESLLRQVWANLLGNAVKYSRERDPATITVDGVAQDEEIIFQVADNGAGFNMDYANKLFGVFQRLHGARQFEGTGIGLANVRRIVQRHGGRTWAEGKVGEGAKFYFTMPNPGRGGPA